MKSLRVVIAKNAVANVARGGASAVVAIALPHFLTHSLGPERFAGWALMLQIAAYANYLDFGLQTAVARYLAGALERRDEELRDRLMSTAVAILVLAGAVALVGLALIAWQLPLLFHSVPLGMISEIRSGVLILAAGAALGLPLSAFTGALIGMQRNEFPAIAIALSRLCGAIAVVATSRYTQNLGALALSLGAFNLLAGFVQCGIARRLMPSLRLEVAFVQRGMATELARYCSTLSVWSFGMLLVTGLDVTIVGMFRFEAAGAYSIAATLILFFTGMNSAAISAMMAPVAIFQSRQEFVRIGRLALTATRLSSYCSLGAVVLVFLLGGQIIRLWVGPSYLSTTLPVLEILLVAQAIRLSGNALGTTLVGMGLQRYGLVPVIVEGVLNLLLSILGMFLMGPLGVAMATLVAAACAQTITIAFVLPRIPEIEISRWQFVEQGIILPLIPFLPCCAWLAARNWSSQWIVPNGIVMSWLTALVLVLTFFLVYREIVRLRS